MAGDGGYLRALLRAIPDMVWLKDPDGKYLFCNSRFESLYGVEEKDLLGKTDYDFADPDTAEMFRSGDRQAAAAGKPTKREEEVAFRSDGHVEILDVIKSPMYAPDGTLLGVLGTARDITERKRLEERLHQARRLESVGRLAGGVAHDFNNMLGIIIGHSELAMEEAAPVEPVVEHLREIRKAAEHSADLTRQLLAFARRQMTTPRKLDLNRTLECMLKVMRSLIGERIELEWNPGSGIWPVRMDPSQVDQILANLCVNARDAIEDIGRITIETRNVSFDEAHCRAHPESLPGDFVLLAVSDTGSGMEKETLERIFEPFFTTKELGKGTGLGLATVYGIVQQNGGFIDVRSEPGTGTVFMIHFPRHKAETERPEPERPFPASKGRETILLVEDVREILTMATLMLERFGYGVLATASPEEAVRIAREYGEKIHLLVSDVILPGMNGAQLAQAISSIRPGIKRLFMSGYTEDAIAHHGVLDAGVHFIQKPFSMHSFSVKVREALEDGR